jgi:hypothetical protein
MKAQPKATGGDAMRVARGTQNPEVKPSLADANRQEPRRPGALRNNSAGDADKFRKAYVQNRPKMAHDATHLLPNSRAKLWIGFAACARKASRQ